MPPAKKKPAGIPKPKKKTLDADDGDIPLAKKPKTANTDGTPTKIAGFCDICLMEDLSKRFGILQTCQTCGVQVHNRCYGRTVPESNDNPDFRDWHHPQLQRDPNWKCWACAAVGTTVETRERDPQTEERIVVKISHRPTECCLCSVSEGFHAMHPLYDCHGRFGRHILLPGHNNKTKLAWAHTLCALSVCRHVGTVYGCEKDGFYDAKDNGEEFKQYDNTPNTFLDRDFTKEPYDNVIHHFVWWGYLQQQQGLKPDQHTKGRLHYQKDLKCVLCGKRDDETTTDLQGRPVPASLRIALQCCANNKDEPKEFKACHRTTLAKFDTCFQALHVGCAAWGRNEQGEQSLARRAWYYPGTYEHLTPNAFLYCDLHAHDLLNNNRNCSSMAGKLEGPFTAPPAGANMTKSDSGKRMEPVYRASSQPVAVGRARFTLNLGQRQQKPSSLRTVAANSTTSTAIATRSFAVSTKMTSEGPSNHDAFTDAYAVVQAGPSGDNTDESHDLNPNPATRNKTKAKKKKRGVTQSKENDSLKQRSSPRLAKRAKRKKVSGCKSTKVGAADPRSENTKEASDVNNQTEDLKNREDNTEPSKDETSSPTKVENDATGPSHDGTAMAMNNEGRPASNGNMDNKTNEEQPIPDAVKLEIDGPQRPPIGSKVRKHFGKNGWFEGEVVAQNQLYSQVRYSDGDEEEMSDHEVEAGITAYQQHRNTATIPTEVSSLGPPALEKPPSQSKTAGGRNVAVKREFELKNPPKRQKKKGDSNTDESAAGAEDQDDTAETNTTSAVASAATLTAPARGSVPFPRILDPRATLAPLLDELCTVLDTSRTSQEHNERVAQCKGSLLQMIRDMKAEIGSQ